MIVRGTYLGPPLPPLEPFSLFAYNFSCVPSILTLQSSPFYSKRVNQPILRSKEPCCCGDVAQKVHFLTNGMIDGTQYATIHTYVEHQVSVCMSRDNQPEESVYSIHHCSISHECTYLAISSFFSFSSRNSYYWASFLKQARLLENAKFNYPGTCVPLEAT